jgi:serine/threonine-protein kinase RsbT
MMIKTYDLKANDFTAAGAISSDIKKIAKSYGMTPEMMRRVAVSCYEAEINMIIHSHGGQIQLNIDDDWFNIVFRDTGPGIDDLELAMQPGWTTASLDAQSMGFGAGMGLPNIKRNVDSFELLSSPKGTLLRMGFRRKGVSI